MKLLFLSLVVLCLVFAISCTSDSSGNGEEKYGYCVSVEEKICLSGGFTECTAGFNLSNNCPYNYSSSLEGQSSSSGGELSSSTLGEQSSSSSIVFGSVEHGGQTYKTVVIGEQTWMAENMTNSVCYDNDESNCDKYGLLYDWATAMDLPGMCNREKCASQINTPHQGICPTGYHIPSNEDWDELLKYIDTDKNGEGSGIPYKSEIAGGYLKSQNGWNSCGSKEVDSFKCLDTYGFAALPGGYGYSTALGMWWSTGESGSEEAYNRLIYAGLSTVEWDNYDKTIGNYVRCMKD